MSTMNKIKSGIMGIVIALTISIPYSFYVFKGNTKLGWFWILAILIMIPIGFGMGYYVWYCNEKNDREHLK